MNYQTTRVLIALALMFASLDCGKDKSNSLINDPIPPTIYDDSPAWAPNGQFIAYIHYAVSLNEPGPFAQIWLYDFQTDSSYRFIYPAVQARWSMDNSKIAFVGAWPSDIYYYDIVLDTIIQVTHDSYHGPFDISPDARSFVTNSSPSVEYGLWTISISGEYIRNITSGSGGGVPRWSNYSGKILYDRGGYKFGISDTFGNFLGYIHDTSWLQYQACWGPEDTIVAITNGMTSDYSDRRTMIFFANRHSGSLDFFTLGWSPDWSYDGQHLTFADRAENPLRFTIWVVRADGTGRREISRRSYVDDTLSFPANGTPRCVLPEAVKARLRGQ